MTFARRVFSITGWYGLIVLTPMYFMEARVGSDQPPPITHPEFFYGFVGVAIAAQLMFLVIARDPQRYRALMPVAVAEKLAFFIPTVILYAQHRVARQVLMMACIDLVLGILFTISYLKTRSEQHLSRSA